jgi:hypothetical protein
MSRVQILPFLWIGLATGSAAAQVPPPLDYPPGPAAVATGSAGVGRWREIASTPLNPALTATLPSFVAELSIFEAGRVGQQGLVGLLAFHGPLGAAYLIEFRQKGVRDLFEDPSVDERVLQVADTAIGLGLAWRLAAGRVAVGLGVRGVWSTVLATRGRVATLDLGAALRPHPKFALGVAFRRLGPALRWTDPSGAAFTTDLAPAFRFGASLGPLAFRVVQLTLSGDVEVGTALGGSEYGLGAEVSLGPAVLFRVGVGRPAAAAPIRTAGLGLVIEGFGLHMAYESVEVVGRRLHLGLRFGGAGERASRHSSERR